MVVAKKYEPGTPVRLAIDRSYRESQMILAIVATAMSAPNLIIMWFIKSHKLVDEKKEKDPSAPESSAEVAEKH